MSQGLVLEALQVQQAGWPLLRQAIQTDLIFWNSLTPNSDNSRP